LTRQFFLYNTSLGLLQHASGVGCGIDAPSMDVQNVTINAPVNVLVASMQSEQDISKHSNKQLTSFTTSRESCVVSQLGLPKTHPLMQTLAMNWNQLFFENGWFKEEDFFIACRSGHREARTFFDSLPCTATL
jgi:hypothetical protein